MDSMSAVSSPQMNASVPKLNSISKSNPVPKTLGPMNPFSRACSMAIRSLLHGQMVPLPDVEIALRRADRIAADEQALDDGVRIALGERPVHLAHVADDVFRVLFLAPADLPLLAGEEAAAAPAAQARPYHLVDHVVGRHAGHRLLRGEIALHGDVLVDVLRVDLAAGAEDDLVLLFME